MDAEQQVGALWNALSRAVEESIRRTGSFTPVGAVLHRDGRIEAVVAAGGVDLLDSEMRAKITCGCIAAVRATNAEARVAEASEPVFGILVRFDNAAGVSQANFMAYELADGQISYGELHAQEGAHDLFGSTAR